MSARRVQTKRLSSQGVLFIQEVEFLPQRLDRQTIAAIATWVDQLSGEDIAISFTMPDLVERGPFACAAYEESNVMSRVDERES